VYLEAGFFGYINKNGELKVSCGGLNPLLIILKQNKNGVYEVNDYRQPADGSAFRDSLKNMFPADIIKKHELYESHPSDDLQKKAYNKAKLYYGIRN
jgi:hypothetical protein